MIFWQASQTFPNRISSYAPRFSSWQSVHSQLNLKHSDAITHIQSESIKTILTTEVTDYTEKFGFSF